MAKGKQSAPPEAGAADGGGATTGLESPETAQGDTNGASDVDRQAPAGGPTAIPMPALSTAGASGEEIPPAPEPQPEKPSAGEPAPEGRRRRGRGRKTTDPEPAAPAAPPPTPTPDEIALLGKAFGSAFDMGFRLLAAKRGPHWRLDEPAREELGKVWSEAMAPYMHTVAKYAPIALAAFVTYGHVQQRVDRDIEIQSGTGPGGIVASTL